MADDKTPLDSRPAKPNLDPHPSPCLIGCLEGLEAALSDIDGEVADLYGHVSPLLSDTHTPSSAEPTEINQGWSPVTKKIIGLQDNAVQIRLAIFNLRQRMDV